MRLYWGAQCRRVVLPGLAAALLPAVLYAGVNRWTRIGPPQSGSEASIHTIAIDPHAPSTIYATGGSGVYRTLDGGATWDRKSPPLGIVRALVVDPAVSGTIYVGGTTGVARSVDSGDTWVAVNTSIGVRTLALQPGSSTVLYAGTELSGIHKSQNGGATWNQVNAGIPLERTPVFGGFLDLPPIIETLVVDRENPSTVYAGTSRGAFKSTNGAGSWTPINAGLTFGGNPAWISSLAIDPLSPATLYAGSSGVFKTENGGESWRRVLGGSVGVRVSSIAIDPVSPSTVYAAAGWDGVFRTTTGGSGWSSINEGLPLGRDVRAIAVDPANPSKLYAGDVSFSPGVFARTVVELCASSPTTLCLNGNRFRVEVSWRAVNLGTSGAGQAVSLTSDTGYFWFFGSDNVELVVKVVDGSVVNGHFWVFYGALSDVEYTIRVSDTATGEVKTYFNAQGNLASVADTAAFAATGSAGQQIASFVPEAVEPAASSACVTEPTALCLNASRFRVRVEWRAPNIGASGVGQAQPLTSDTGYFWFFSANNVELIVKVVDGRGFNGKFWVFYGALSDVEYTITVTDTETGTERVYFNPQGQLTSVADTSAF